LILSEQKGQKMLYNDFCNAIKEVIPAAEIQFDDNREIVIYTNKTIDEDVNIVDFDPDED
jgi:hypothetical protein